MNRFCLKFATLITLSSVSAQALDVYHSSRQRSDQYFFGSPAYRDPVFDDFRIISLNGSIGIGADCGQISFKNTLQASLKNILDTKYLEDIGKNILAASPMLAACYFSPTWCAILKHSQIKAGQLSKLRLDQCALIDKYVDSRVEDYYIERQAQTRASIQNSGGNLEAALEGTQDKKMFEADLKSWAGDGTHAAENRLIGSSAKWAGLRGPKVNSTLDLVKSLVGDTVLAKGNVSVEFGPGGRTLTALSLMRSVEKVTFEKLCAGVVKKVGSSASPLSPEKSISSGELKALSPEFDNALVDHQTLRSLSLMERGKREVACRKLSGAVSFTVFKRKVTRALEVLSILGRNPHLPEHRKVELERKRRRLKESLDVLVKTKQKDPSLNQVLAKINAEGERIRSASVRSRLGLEASREDNEIVESRFIDCSDGIMCKGGWNVQ